MKLSVEEHRGSPLFGITAKTFLVFILFVVLWGTSSQVAAQSVSPSLAIKRLFIVHSYEEGHLCGQPQHDGVLAGLAAAGWKVDENLDVRTYYMDTKRINNTPALIEKEAALALREIQRFGPDVTLTLDDNAFRTVGLAAEMAGNTVIFCGLNGQPEDYNAQREFMQSRENPAGRVTGVYEKLHVREAIRVMTIMHDLKKILVLEDLSPTGRAIGRQFDIELGEVDRESGIGPDCAIERKTIPSWQGFREAISLANDDQDTGAIYLGTLLLHDSQGQTYTAEEIIDYFIEHSQKPAIGLNYAFIKQGLYGGATVDFFAMGRLAGEKVAAVFSGSAPGSIPIEDAPRVALVFNLERAESLGLEIPSDILMAADEVFRK